MARVSYYNVLGLPMDASTSQIKTRYKELAKKYHPDHNGSDKAMSLINEAYSVLSNPRLRFQYNHSIHNQLKSRAKSTHNPHTSKKPNKTYENNTKNRGIKFNLLNRRSSRMVGMMVISLVAILIIVGIVGSLAAMKNTNNLEVSRSSTPSDRQSNNSLATELKQAQAKIKKEQALAIQYAEQVLKYKALSNESGLLKNSQQQNISRESSLLNLSQQNTNQCAIGKSASKQKPKNDKTNSLDCQENN